MSIQILMKRTFLLHIIFLICITISGCRGKAPDEQGRTGAVHAGSGEITDTSYQPAYGDALVVGSIGEPSVLIPMLAGDSASHNIAGLIFNGLVKYDTDLTVTGDLAESWDISPDGLVITFYLKRGVRWADGIEFTAHDVMFGYETIIDEKTPTPYKEDYLQVKRAEVLDAYTFRATYEKPFAPALTTWGSLVVLPKHVLKGKDITKGDFDFRRNPMGMGPYRLVRWTPGQEVVLDSNRDLQHCF
jgi:peptide/nickel transport system substrate-binding protein